MELQGGRHLPPGRVAAETVGLALAYAVTARAGLSMATVGHSVTLVWPPSGLAVAALLARGTRLWPGVAVAAFVINATTPGVPLGSALMMAAGNTGEALLATWLLRRAHFDLAMRRVPDV